MCKYRICKSAAYALLLVSLAVASGCTDYPETTPLYDASSVAAGPTVIATQAAGERDAPAYATSGRASGASYFEDGYRMGSGDRLRITVFGEETLTGEYLIDGAGTISMPLIAQVQVGGRTTREAQALVAAKLRDGYLRNPNVTVQVLTYRPFFILGEVRTAGQYPYVSGMTVQTAVAIAGGYTPRARKSRFKVTRQTPAGRRTFMLRPGAPVAPGDTIYVDERFF